MIGPQVQKAISDALSAAPQIASGGIFDEVPQTLIDTAFPRVTIGTEQIIDDGNSCEDGWEVIADVDIWSRQPGFLEAKTIQASVVSRITGITSIGGHTLIATELERATGLRDPDGKTRHIALSFRFVITPA